MDNLDHHLKPPFGRHNSAGQKEGLMPVGEVGRVNDLSRQGNRFPNADKGGIWQLLRELARALREQHRRLVE